MVITSPSYYIRSKKQQPAAVFMSKIMGTVVTVSVKEGMNIAGSSSLKREIWVSPDIVLEVNSNCILNYSVLNYYT